jgi:hypothetical protein
MVWPGVSRDKIGVGDLLVSLIMGARYAVVCQSKGEDLKPTFSAKTRKRWMGLK